MSVLDQQALDQLFYQARSMNSWTDKSVSEEQLKKLYDLVSMGPTSANCSPARFVFVTSQAGKEKLASMAMEGNRQKILTAPVTVIIGHDYHFADHLPHLFPHDLSAPSWFEDTDVRDVTAFRNGTLQGAYLMMAARALGLDCGPMSGFDNGAVDAAFFKNGAFKGKDVRSNFICGLGYGDAAGLFPRSPRLNFQSAAEIV